jgi:Xaa-Pro aminopeptidase
MIRKAEIDSRGRLRDQAGVLTAERLKQAIHVTMLQHNCMGVGTITACGCAAADPHETGTGPLMAGQGIVLDIFPRHLEHGYWGDLSRTVVKGDPPLKLKKMHQAVRRAQRLALANIRAGVIARRIYDLVLDSLTEAGFPTTMSGGVMEGFIHSVGHGLGLEVHEAPGIGLGTNRLRAGQVVTVEPGLYYREIGGVRIEDVVVVTATGRRVLYPCPHVFRL